MADQSIQPALLDYATRLPRAWRPFIRFYSAMLFCLFIGGATGWLVSPTLYRSEGSFEIQPVVHNPADVSEVTSVVQQRVRANLDALHSDEHLTEVSNRLRVQGIHLTTAEINDRLLISHDPQSQLISVSATDHDPKVAATIVTESIAGFPVDQLKRTRYEEALDGGGIHAIIDGNTAQPLTYAPYFAAIGATIGLIGWSLNEFRRRAGMFVLAGRPRTRIFEY